MSDDFDGEVDQPSTVYAIGRQAGGGPERKIHTDPNCPIVESAPTVIPKDRSVYPPEKEVCKVCDGGVDQPDTHDTSHYLALKRAAEGGQ